MDSNQLAQACAEQLLREDFASQAMGVQLVTATATKAEATMRVRDDMVNGHGICHGGMLYFFADAALGFASNAENQRAVSTACTIDYLKPAYQGEELVAVTSVIKQGKRNGLFTVDVFNPGGELLAVFTGRTARIQGVLLDAAAIKTLESNTAPNTTEQPCG